jgi:uncharacterized membrane protein
VLLLRALPWVLWVTLVLFSLATYATLPEQIPQHLNAAGEVTRTMQRSIWSWLLLPGIAGLTLGLVSWAGAFVARRPEYFNFPEKERFLKIPHEYRGPVLVRMRETLDVTGVFLIVVMGYVQLMMWRSAQGTNVQGMSLGLLVGTILFTPGILILTSRVNTAVDEAERRWKGAERHTPRS